MFSPRLFIICGLPGVGKTTLAHALAERLSAAVVTSEKVVAELFPPVQTTKQDRDFTPEQLSRGYEAMCMKARENLSQGRNVILEGSFRSVAQRQEVFRVAEDLRVPVSFVYVTCPEGVLQERLERRFQASSHQFGYQAHLAVKKVFEPVTTYDFHIDTSLDLAPQIDAIITSLE